MINGSLPCDYLTEVLFVLWWPLGKISVRRSGVVQGAVVHMARSALLRSSCKIMFGEITLTTHP